jgi:hypothetical protein
LGKAEEGGLDDFRIVELRGKIFNHRYWGRWPSHQKHHNDLSAIVGALQAIESASVLNPRNELKMGDIPFLEEQDTMSQSTMQNSSAPNQAKIASLAYALWVERGRPEGSSDYRLARSGRRIERA